MNYECNVVSDLLPSYVEKLLSKETEKYIENHVSSCESCREKLQIMQEQYLDNKKNSEEEDKIEFDFLKKVKKKNQIFKIITIIFFIIIIANIIIKEIVAERPLLSPIFLNLLASGFEIQQITTPI